MDAVGSSGQSTDQAADQGKSGQGIGGWIGRHPGLIPLVVALILAFLLPRAIAAGASINQPIEIGAARVALLALVWLGAGLVISLIVAVAGASVGGDLATVTRRFLRGSTGSPGGAVHVDAPARGAEVVAKLFGLALYMLIQSVLRPPIVAVGVNFVPQAVIDSGYVIVVVLIALVLLLSLYHSARPLIQHLTWVGLDRLVPTAGYATKAPTAATPTRSNPTKGSRPAPARATPPQAVEATRPGAAEATVAGGLPPSPSLAVDATVPGSPASGAANGEDAGFTMIGVPPPPPVTNARLSDVTIVGVPPAPIGLPAEEPDVADATVIGVPREIGSALANTWDASHASAAGPAQAEMTLIGLPHSEPFAGVAQPTSAADPVPSKGTFGSDVSPNGETGRSAVDGHSADELDTGRQPLTSDAGHVAPEAAIEPATTAASKPEDPLDQPALAGSAAPIDAAGASISDETPATETPAAAVPDATPVEILADSDAEATFVSIAESIDEAAPTIAESPTVPESAPDDLESADSVAEREAAAGDNLEHGTPLGGAPIGSLEIQPTPDSPERSTDRAPASVAAALSQPDSGIVAEVTERDHSESAIDAALDATAVLDVAAEPEGPEAPIEVATETEQREAAGVAAKESAHAEPDTVVPPADVAAPISEPNSRPAVVPPVAEPGPRADRFAFLARRPATPSALPTSSADATLVDATLAPKTASVEQVAATSAPIVPVPTAGAPATPVEVAAEVVPQPAAEDARPVAPAPESPSVVSAQPAAQPAAPKASQFGFLGRATGQPTRQTSSSRASAARPTDQTIAADDSDRTIVPDEPDRRGD